MRQDEIYQLLHKYNEGRCTPEEEEIVEAWYRSIATHQDQRSAFEKEFTKSRTRSRVLRHASNDLVHIQRERRFRLSPAWSVAAALLVLAMSLLFVFAGPKSIPFSSTADQQRAVSKEVRNTTADVICIVLSDGSHVDLKPNSRIMFAERFERGERLVSLEGEAFFEVTRDTLAPFVVNAGAVVTRVLGTSFTVKAFLSDDSIVVSVTSGKVAVMTGRDNRSLEETILTPNQRIIYDKTNRTVVRGIVPEPRKLLPPEEIRRLRFEAVPVTEIFEALEKVYGVDIDFDRALFSSCKLTTSIADGNIFNRLEMICKAINADYQLHENRIIISGQGCSPETGRE